MRTLLLRAGEIDPDADHRQAFAELEERGLASLAAEGDRARDGDASRGSPTCATSGQAYELHDPRPRRARRRRPADRAVRRRARAHLRPRLARRPGRPRLDPDARPRRRATTAGATRLRVRRAGRRRVPDAQRLLRPGRGHARRSRGLQRAALDGGLVRGRSSSTSTTRPASSRRAAPRRLDAFGASTSMSTSREPECLAIGSPITLEVIKNALALGRRRDGADGDAQRLLARRARHDGLLDGALRPPRPGRRAGPDARRSARHVPDRDALRARGVRRSRRSRATST